VERRGGTTNFEGIGVIDDVGVDLQSRAMPENLSTELIKQIAESATELKGLREIISELKSTVEELADRVSADTDELRREVRELPTIEYRIGQIEARQKEIVAGLEKQQAQVDAELKDLRKEVTRLNNNEWFQKGIAAAAGFGGSLAMKFIFK
jgi:DNA repair ATPase RecN